MWANPFPMRVIRNFFGEELQSHVATKVEAFSFVDYTHTSAANFPEYTVMKNYRSHELGVRGHERKWYERSAERSMVDGHAST